MHYLVLLGEESQVEAWFRQFGDSANPYARYVHGLHGTYHMLGNQFGCTRWNSLTTCHMESRFGPFGDIVSFGAR